ncbi:MAG: S8 family serine peptidase, partial [Anaerolineae bacterium]|nr:S8 family serine peptidase [Anaerolineae bacterium]
MRNRCWLLMRSILGLPLVVAMLFSSLFSVPVPATLARAQVPETDPPPQEASQSPEAVPPAANTMTAATTPVTHTIRLQSRQFAPTEADAQALGRPASTERDRTHVLVQLDFIPRDAAKTELEARGLRLLAYVPDYAWIASVPAMNPAAVLELPGVTWAGALTTQDKVAPAITQNLWGPHNLAPDGTAAVYVALHADVSLDSGRTAVARYGGRVTGEVAGIHLLVVEMPRGNIESLASEDIVQWVEPASPPLTGTNDGSRQQIGVDLLQASPYNLDGTGIDVLVYDSGQAGDHVDFGTRLVHGDADAVSDHSTHVAGTVGGSGLNSVAQGGSALQWRGMAPNVDLFSYGTTYPGSGVIFYENVPDIEQDWAQAQNTYGADLGTASLGSNIYDNYYPGSCSLMGNYGAASVLIDQIVRGGNSVVGIGDKYIATWAAGNERNQTTSCPGIGGGYGLVAPPAGAKNPIHVGGANTNNNEQYVHTSWGPTDDGRLKPIVTAGACQTTGDGGITSTDNFPVDDYLVMCGTSMATPAVAGGIA